MPEALPLKGWMTFAGLSLGFAPWSFVLALGQVWTTVREHSFALLDAPEAGAWLRGALLELAGLAVLSGLAIFTLPRFIGRRQSAPKLMQAFFLGTFLLGLWSRWRLTSLGLAVAPAQDASLVASLLWLTAFRTSNDVPRVFVR